MESIKPGDLVTLSPYDGLGTNPFLVREVHSYDGLGTNPFLVLEVHSYDGLGTNPFLVPEVHSMDLIHPLYVRALNGTTWWARAKGVRVISSVQSSTLK